MRIIIDTNWYISLLIKKNESRLHFILLNPSIELIISDELLNELTGKIKEEKFRKYFSLDYALKFVAVLKFRVSKTQIVSKITICRDAKDNFLLSLSKDSNADYLITGDGDLLILEQFEKTTICTLPDFIEKYLKK